MKDQPTLNNGKAAWIIEWHYPTWNERSKRLDLRPYILPSRWPDRRIFDFMRCLFWNSCLFHPTETLRGVNGSGLRCVDPRDGCEMNYGPQLTYGIFGDPFMLIAGHTKNLSISRDESGQFLVEWTRPPGSRRDDSTNSIVPDGSPVERRWILTRGRWLCESDL